MSMYHTSLSANDFSFIVLCAICRTSCDILRDIGSTYDDDDERAEMQLAN
jgi:hypothetical protein